MNPDDFRRYRKTLDLTQKELAEVLEVGIRTVQRWETGETPIPGPAGLCVDIMSLCCTVEIEDSPTLGRTIYISNKFADKVGHCE